MYQLKTLTKTLTTMATYSINQKINAKAGLIATVLANKNAYSGLLSPIGKIIDAFGPSLIQADKHINSVGLKPNWRNFNKYVVIDQKGPFFMLKGGRDCDGGFTPGVERFENRSEAYKCLNSHMEGSDGLVYWITTNEAEVIDYITCV